MNLLYNFADTTTGIKKCCYFLRCNNIIDYRVYDYYNRPSPTVHNNAISLLNILKSRLCNKKPVKWSIKILIYYNIDIKIAIFGGQLMRTSE